jgi:agmatinase
MAQHGYYPTYAGIQTFMRAPYEPRPERRVAVVGVPYDGCSSNRAGSREAPAAIRKMSLTFDADRDRQYPHGRRITSPLVDAGDVMVPPTGQHEAIERHLTSLVPLNKLIVLGGDHSITLDSLRAHRSKYGRMALLHFDAHPDTWDDEYPSHGTFVTTALHEGLICLESSLQIGIRTVGPAYGIKQITAYEYRHRRAVKAIHQMVDSGLPVYMTFDVDCLDPAYAPGTGTPVSGGLSSREVLRLLTEVHQKLELCGMDVVEVCPAYDHAGITALAAATVIQHVIQD